MGVLLPASCVSVLLPSLPIGMLMQGLWTCSLALWVFLLPTILPKAEAWLKSHGFEAGFQAGGKEAKLDEEEILALQQDMGYEHDKDTGSQTANVVLIYQAHGEVVHVPSGYMHMVLNLQPCIKMAWEHWRGENLFDYILSWKFISSQFTTASNSLDYTNTVGVIRNLLVKHMQAWHRSQV